MKYKKAKLILLVLCILITGICYTVSRFSYQRTDSTKLSPSTKEMEETSGTVSQEKISEESKGSSFSDALAEGSLPCYIHICGEVVFPGVYQLSEESRVFEAVEKAGGFTPQAAPEHLNMAERIRDGMKIVVLSREEAVTAGNPNSGETGKKDSKLNINTASKEELMTLRGVGEAKAGDIIKYRDSHGGFKRIEDIMNISGIKDAAFQKIKDDITV